jgi:uncharacterized membrane protein
VNQPISPKHSKRLIQSFEAKALKKRSMSVRFADSLTAFFGTFSFLTINIIVFALWIAINLGFLPIMAPFDPFPFVLMTTAVSLEAIILSCIVLMSQSRSGIISALREEMQLQVNFYTEREITKILKMMAVLMRNHKIKIEDDPELAGMLQDLDHSFIEKKLTEQLTPKEMNPFEMVTRPVEELGKVVTDAIPFKGK